MPVLAAMRKGETRRVRKSVWCSVHDLGNHRQGAHGPRSHARNEQQFGEVDRCPICCCSKIGVKTRRQHVAWADIVTLKAGLWFRRTRFVIVAPDPQPSWPLSGKNSTYPTVQICRASSE